MRTEEIVALFVGAIVAGLATSLIWFVGAQGDWEEIDKLESQVRQLRVERRVCPMCEGKGIVTLPEVATIEVTEK